MYCKDWDYGTKTYLRRLNEKGRLILPSLWAEIAYDKGLRLILRRLPEAEGVYYIQGVDEIGFDSLRRMYELNGVLETIKNWRWFCSSSSECHINTNRSVRIPDSFLAAAGIKKESYVTVTGRTNWFLIFRSDPSLEERLQKELRQEWLATIDAYALLRQPRLKIG